MLVLASSSPQRRAILERLGVSFEVVEPDVEELTRGDPVALAAENAMRKARAVQELLAGRAGAADAQLILGADTVVALEGTVYGKPTDEVHARAMLGALSGRTHTVVGGAVILAGEEARRVSAQTLVRFRALDDALLGWYLATEEWRGRAGGYAIQGAGAALVTEVVGDYENVVGLPVAALIDACPGLLST